MYWKKYSRSYFEIERKNMKNKEKYIDELTEVLINNLAIDKKSGSFNRCHTMICDDCLFLKGTPCSDVKREWLEAEYQEPIHLTDDEIVILKVINKKYKWIVKDKCGSLYIYEEKPWKGSSIWDNGYGNYVECHIFDHLFQFIKWEDEKPYSIDELLKQNGVER